MITTVTLNPARDRLLETDEITVGEANRVRLLSASAAGKGIDVAKILRDLDWTVAATGFLGGEVAEFFIRCFNEEKIANHFVRIKGTTRTNIQLFEKNGARTELLEKGPTVTAEECSLLMKQFSVLAGKSDAVTICGSVPDGVSRDYFHKLIQTARKQSDYVIVDTSGTWLSIALEEKPDLIKPNRREMAELMGKEQVTDEEIIAFAQELVHNGLSYVLVSLGGDGAILIGQKGVWRGKAPKVEVKSTLGCGDAMVASVSVSLAERLAPRDMLQRSIALSAANAMTFDTAHVILSDYQKLLRRIDIEKIK